MKPLAFEVEERLAEIGVPVRPGLRPRPLAAGALDQIHRVVLEAACSKTVEGDLLAGYVSALQAEFPTLHASRTWPQIRVQDPGRFLKFRRLARAHLAQIL